MFAARGRKESGNGADGALFDRIGGFLRDQRLPVNPTNFTFAYHVLSDPDGQLARVVAGLTDDGVRLTREDIESLGHRVDGDGADEGQAARERAETLMAQTRDQVAGLEDIVRSVRVEAGDFGRDLKASADALRNRAPDQQRIIDDVARITAGMLQRVEHSESRLEAATREASELRVELEQARGEALHDALTGLPNRRAFEDAFAERVAAGEDATVAIVDVDHFKAVNDRFGHSVGDRVLKAIADTLSEGCGSDLVTRYGGEEFTVLFTGGDAAASRAILDAARETIAAKRYRLRETETPLGAITVSAGLTRTWPGERWSAAFQRADKLLYQAKARGRNCIVQG